MRVLALILLGVSMAGAPVPASGQEPVDLYGKHDGYVLSIQATGDMNGLIEPCGCKLPVGGLARRAGYAAELARRLEGKAGILKVDAGRVFDPARKQSEAVYDSAIKNEWILRALGVARFDVLNVAVPDLRVLDPLRAKAGYDERVKEFPALDAFISANVEPANAEFVGFKPYVVLNVPPPSSASQSDVIRVGILGVTGMPDRVEPGSHWKVSDPLAAARKYGAELRAKCDFLIVLAHLDENSANRIEEAVPGVDLIVVANRKAAPKGEMDLDRPATVAVGDEAKSITELRLFPSLGPAAARRWTIRRRTVLLSPDVPDDPETRLTVQRAKGASWKLKPVAQ